MAWTLRVERRRSSSTRGVRAMRSARICAAVALVAGSAACAHRPSREEAAPTRQERPTTRRAGEEVGLASFYGNRFQGRTTASGARFDKRAFTCAHPTAPFGTRLRVTELETGRSVVVTVTDRGPFARGRVVDVSLAAARALGIVQRGVARVRVEPLAE